MSIKDIYEIANKVEGAKLAFTRIANTAFQMNYLRKSLFPSIGAYSNLLPKFNIIKNIATPSILQIAQQQQSLINQIAPQIKLFSEQQKMLNSITPQIALVSEAMQPYLVMRELMQKYDFVAINRRWAEISEVLARERVDSILLSDYWLIMDDNLFEELKSNCYNKKFNPNKHIVRYYSNHKFANIEKVLKQIKQVNCLCNKRIDILEDCYTAMKQLSCKVACNTIIPTLSAQADGILNEIIKLIPKEILDQILEESQKTKNSTATIILAYLETLMVHGGTIEKFKVVIKEKAFGKTKKNAKYQKSRNSVLHGSCSYGSKENLVRAWLEIAFLMKIYYLILLEQHKQAA